MKTWLKGGLIGGVVYFLIIFLAFITNDSSLENNILRIILNFSIYNPYSVPIISLVLFFIIGAVIGLIIQKIKK